MPNLRQVLHAWRDHEAAKKGVELFRVLANSSIDEIIRLMPSTKEELVSVKGIKEAKFAQYGKTILAMVAEHGGKTKESPLSAPSDAMKKIEEMLPVTRKEQVERTIFTVSSYLDEVNRSLWRLNAPVKGEITSFKSQGNASYFTLKDDDDGSTLSVFMWANDLAMSGIELSDGLEVVVVGRSEIYKPSGRYNFRAESIELVGEGALQLAYTKLRLRLEAEGLFALEKKRSLDGHPIKIGLVTSRSGAVIHDFLSNLGKHGFQITFVDSRVEGTGAIKEILAALDYLQKRDIEVLVVIRGGGSLESMQAFNNELVVRRIAEFPVPTICAIGHDKDVPLAQLASDYAPSTPTATTQILNESWRLSRHELALLSRELSTHFSNNLQTFRDDVRKYRERIIDTYEKIIAPQRLLMSGFSDLLSQIARSLSEKKDELQYIHRTLVEQFRQNLRSMEQVQHLTEKLLKQHDPIRQLKMGYSILMSSGRTVRSVKDLQIGANFEARMADGILVAEIKEKLP